MKGSFQMHGSYVVIPVVLFALLLVGVMVADIRRQRQEEQGED